MSAASPPSQAVPNGSVPALNVPHDERGIYQTLREIRAREIKKPPRNSLFSFLFNISPIRSAILYILLVYLETLRYFHWLYVTWETFFLRTWDGIVEALKDLIRRTPESEESQGTYVSDWLAYALFAFGGTVVLPFVLVLCLVARFPPLTGIYYAWSAFFGGNHGLINSSNPNLFKSLTVEQADAGKDALADPLEPPTDAVRHFNFDIAKLLLQIASVVYEHSNDAIRNAAFGGVDSFRRDFTFLESPGDATIRRFCRQFDIEYQPISGTGPVEFGDWLSDLDATMVSCADYIPNFRRVHKGFKERVFPDKGLRPAERQDQRPYNTISMSVKALVAHLSARHAGQQINVWFTGHSLMRCATATLIYSRMLMKPEEVGENGILRDAYLFAAPIVADPQSVIAFNEKIFEQGAPKRTMWRITSNDDFVATGLPEFGDHLPISDIESLHTDRKNNLFFSHFGIEIVLYDHPHSSSVPDHRLTPKHTVVIDSAFTQAEIRFCRPAAPPSRKDHRSLPQYVLCLSLEADISLTDRPTPPINRSPSAAPIAHYWDQLDRITLGTCDRTID
ncbi:hypothetical protein BS47DRAFT_1391347 [Hydnum rufescens UP504]|uniref:Fungal lipase-type domain-containing protein n=1 Tax=Hydnum rufescens UP504 TaxID=1448309 RepID=A0A9P6B1C4_9AGAM|nr:hypothetical protein BS47DRAFT_1391347 [Hydnum rufescens UP504]